MVHSLCLKINLSVLTLGSTRKVITPPWYNGRGWGEGGEVVGLGSPSWSPSWILSRIKNQIKTMRINNFLRLKVHVINNSFASFKPQALLLFLKEVEKTCIFLKKWLDHLPLMTSYLVPKLNTGLALRQRADIL